MHGPQDIPEKCSGIFLAYAGLAADVTTDENINPAKIINKVFEELCPKTGEIMPCFNAIMDSVDCSGSDKILLGMPGVPEDFQDVTLADVDFLLTAIVAAFKSNCEAKNNPFVNAHSVEQFETCIRKTGELSQEEQLKLSTDVMQIDFTTGGKPLSAEDCSKMDAIVATLIYALGEPTECEDFYPFIKQTTYTLLDSLCGRASSASRLYLYWASVAVMSGVTMVL
ncbi:PREDICTED: uncharacterized protein LOC106812000 [Priapulus caudatus]|uniref:Uncharacterized protein LOC106812000 n=1 Tax=Priapulus caudatus TaxID=37621 RepID=A0ABM1EGA7_PRICU|nr:PREDICTED: uncharacterized protein LOC106812000 [Priapulus caudatus]